MKSAVLSTTLLASLAYAQSAPYGQCGGQNWSGATTCSSGYTCQVQNPYYSQCLQGSSGGSSGGSNPPAPAPAPPSSSVAAPYGQCGGQEWSGATVCSSGFACQVQNPYYSQCLQGGSGSSGGNPPAPPPPSTLSTVITPVSTPASMPSSVPSSAPVPAPSKGTQYAGINIAGFDFGCATDGTCTVSSVYPPVPNGNNNAPDGPGQMAHFVNDDNLNAFRLPVAWQYLVNAVLGGPLDPTNAGEYDQLVQACLKSGASCIIDIHNYARWDGQIIGQGGPSNDQFASLWSQLATKYASESKVIFGVVNEPHDIPSIATWAETVQAVVTAIRQAGATTQMILLPGNDYTSAATFISNGSGGALMSITNPDGTTTNLIFDVHKYLDSDGSGTNAECVSDNISAAFAPLAAWLRQNNRQAFLSETGGGNTASCQQYLCSALNFINSNSDVYVGYTTWAAGSFATSYVLSETPTNNGGTWTDQPLVTQCIAR